jgi:hypothetical protein
VATVIQKVGSDGQLTIQVEPPGPEHESDLANTANQHSLGECRLFYTNCRNIGTEVPLQEQVHLIKYLLFSIFHTLCISLFVVIFCPVLYCW